MQEEEEKQVDHYQTQDVGNNNYHNYESDHGGKDRYEYNSEVFDEKYRLEDDDVINNTTHKPDPTTNHSRHLDDKRRLEGMGEESERLDYEDEEEEGDQQIKDFKGIEKKKLANS